MVSDATPLLVLGATGRIGRVLRAQESLFLDAGLRPIWQSRASQPGFSSWDTLAEPCPDGVAGGIVLCLAGVIQGDAKALALNEALAMVACKAAEQQGARHVFLASSAAVYCPSIAALSESAETAPPAAYGAAKLAMERAALRLHRQGGPGLTILRIGNIAGLDALLGRVQAGVTTQLDRVDGQVGGPVRSYIGPKTLGSVLARLSFMAAQGQSLPKILNVAAAPPVSMAALLDAAGADWAYREPGPDLIPRVELDTTLLRSLIDIPTSAGQAAQMVAEWRGLAK